MRKTSVRKLALAIAMMVVLPLATHAKTNVNLTQVILPAEQTIVGNYYAAGNVINVAGHVTGDVMCAGEQVFISGQVDGDVLCAAKKLVVTGNVLGSVRGIANLVSIENGVGRNLTVLASHLYLATNSVVKMDAMFLAAEVNLLGTVDGNVYGGSSRVALAGQVGKNVELVLEDGKWKGNTAPFFVDKAGKVGGNITYEGRYDVDLADRLNIAGQIVKKQGDGMYFNPMKSMMNTWMWYKVICIFGALIIGLLIMLLFKKQVVHLADKMVEKPMMNIGWGLLLIYLVPFLVVFSAITIVGLPLSVIVGLLWIACVMLAKPLMAIVVGIVILGRYRYKVAKGKTRPEVMNPIATMVLGVAVTYFLFTIPFVGSVLGLIAVAWVIGAAWMLMKDLSLKK